MYEWSSRLNSPWGTQCITFVICLPFLLKSCFDGGESFLLTFVRFCSGFFVIFISYKFNHVLFTALILFKEFLDSLNVPRDSKFIRSSVGCAIAITLCDENESYQISSHCWKILFIPFTIEALPQTSIDSRQLIDFSFGIQEEKKNNLVFYDMLVRIGGKLWEDEKKGCLCIMQ